MQNQNMVLFVSNQLNTISLAIENYAIFIQELKDRKIERFMEERD